MKSIIVFGDSITFGRFDNSNGGWVGRLKKEFEAQDSFHVVYNQGVPGDTSKGLLERIDTECISRARYVWNGDRHIILIAIGINDSRGVEEPGNYVPINEFKSNVEQIIKIARKHSKEIAIIGLTPVDESLTNPFENTYFKNHIIESYNSTLKSICKDEYYIDVYDEMKKVDYPKLLADGLHPNPKGYDFMFKIIKNALTIFA